VKISDTSRSPVALSSEPNAARTMSRNHSPVEHQRLAGHIGQPQLVEDPDRLLRLDQIERQLGHERAP
jgi:hypothetical protein